MKNFFFSSRRRHTRCSRDWSSDVCSSDLREQAKQVRVRDAGLLRDVLRGRAVQAAPCELLRCHLHQDLRSEERRVGAEGRTGMRRQREEDLSREAWEVVSISEIAREGKEA